MLRKDPMTKCECGKVVYAYLTKAARNVLIGNTVRENATSKHYRCPDCKRDWCEFEHSSKTVLLDGDFTATDLHAIAVYMGQRR